MKRRCPGISGTKEEGVLRIRHALRRRCYEEGCVSEEAAITQTKV